jgi:hypothetical protein
VVTNAIVLLDLCSTYDADRGLREVNAQRLKALQAPGHLFNEGVGREGVRDTQRHARRPVNVHRLIAELGAAGACMGVDVVKTGAPAVLFLLEQESISPSASSAGVQQIQNPGDSGVDHGAVADDGPALADDHVPKLTIIYPWLTTT